MAEAQAAASKNEAEVFGKDPVRNTDGKPLERGSGSPWASMTPAARAHYLAVESAAAVEALVEQTRALLVTANRVAESHKAYVDEAGRAKDTTVARAVPADAPPYGVLNTKV